VVVVMVEVMVVVVVVDAVDAEKIHIKTYILLTLYNGCLAELVILMLILTTGLGFNSQTVHIYFFF
jgi:hypothetical protein